MKNYNALVTFIDGEQIIYPTFEAKNMKVAKTKVMLDRQRKDDEMWVKSIKIYPAVNHNKDK